MKNGIIKDESILRLIEKLKCAMGEDAFSVVDHWDADLLAIGIAKPENNDLLVYVSTYRQPFGSYFVSLQFPARPFSELPYSQGDEFQVRGFHELVEVIQRHFASG